MKIYEERIIPEITKKVCVKNKCDLCGAESKRVDGWGDSIYDVEETEILVSIKQKEGCSYPEGGSGVEKAVDLCPDCFKNKLIPWLISQGANIQEKEWDW